MPSPSRGVRPAETTSNPPAKRRRVALACSNCRHRKSRCDGRRPKCSLCSELGCECQYEQAGTPITLTVGKSFIALLEDRLQRMETDIDQLRQSSGRATVIATGDSHTMRSQSPMQPVNHSVDISLESDSYGSGNPAEIGALDTAEDSIDGMGAMKFTDEEDCGYFGPSSNIAFLRHISFAMARRNGSGQGLPLPSLRKVNETMSVSRLHHGPTKPEASLSDANHQKVNMYALPPEERTWTLIGQYFRKTGQLLPFIHEASFRETYFQMQRNKFTMARRTWLGLLNIVFAMATTLSVEGYPSAEERIKESEVYYQRANALCDKEFKRNISLELVQYLLVLGQYLQGTQRSVQAWTVHGFAITTALQLGLHSPKSNTGLSPLELETRKRVWYGCILLDRTLSMTFGRPSMIPDGYVKVQLPSTEMHMVGPAPQSELSPQMDAMFFVATIKLYGVMYQIIDTCYGQNFGLEAGLEDSEIIPLVFSGESSLKKQMVEISRQYFLYIYESPIQSENLVTIEQQNLIAERFNIVISLRYHNIRILLHRPILERILDARASSQDPDDQNQSILQQVGIRNVGACVDSAKIIISIVHSVVLSSDWRRDLLGAWNYSLFYTFNAGLVLFAALLIAPQSVKEDIIQPSSPWAFIERAPQYLNMAITALQNLDRKNRVVTRCVEYLTQLCSMYLSSWSTPTDEVAFSLPLRNSDILRSGQTEPHTTLNNHDWSLRDSLMDMDLNEFMLDIDLATWFEAP